MTTIMSMSTTGLAFLAMRPCFSSISECKNFGCFYITNAMLSGAVSISASCDYIEVWNSVVISLFAAILYSLCSKLLIKAEIDDPQEAFVIFGVNGFWAVIAVGIFDREKGLVAG